MEKKKSCIFQALMQSILELVSIFVSANTISKPFEHRCWEVLIQDSICIYN